MYLCVGFKMLKAVKISGIFPWVNLIQIIYNAPSLSNPLFHHLLFVFKDKPIRLLSVNPGPILEKTIINLYQLFGPDPPIHIETTPLDFSSESKQPFYLCNLFASYCISNELSINEQIYHMLESIQNEAEESKEGMIVNVQRLKSDPKYTFPLLTALYRSRNISNLIISGNDVQSFFDYINVVIENNKDTLNSLTIDGCNTLTNIELMYKALISSNVNFLSFKNVTFTDTFIKPFIEFMGKSLVSQISFVRCKFADGTFKEFSNHSNEFKDMDSLIISHTNSLKNNETFLDLFNFIFSIKLPNLSLIDIGTDITMIFDILNSKSIPLISLDLSYNKCTNFNGRCNLPITLAELKLSHVQWDINSLYNILDSQKFVTKISLNVSSIVGTTFNDIKYLKPKKSSYSIKEFYWKNNTINSVFIEFISNLPNLESLGIDGCEIENNLNDPIMSKIVTFLQNCKLKKLSMCGTKIRNYQNKIQEFFGSFATSTTLESISISKNNIGDKGLESFVEVCAKNNLIKSVNFSKNNFQNPLKFIECCNRLSEINHLEYVTKSKKDLSKLYHNAQKFGVDPSKISAAWKNLQEKLKNNRLKNENVYNSDSILIQDGNYQKSHIAKQTASWEMTILVPYNKQPSQWEELRKNFSLENLTGFPPDETDSLIDL